MNVEEAIYDNELGNIPVIRIDGKPCNYVVIDSKIATKYKSYVLLCKDLEVCIECIEDIQKLNSIKDEILTDKLKHKLLITAIITYGKCYSKSKNRSSLEWKTVSSFLNSNPIFSNENLIINDRMSVLHDKIINMRNDYIAHHLNVENEEVLFWCYLNPNFNDKGIIQFSTRIKYVTDIDNFIEEARNLFVFAYNYCNHQKELHFKKLEKTLDINELYKNSKVISK